MASKVIVICAMALLIQIAIGQNCGCGSGSGSVLAVGIGSFKGGNFIRDSSSSNTESLSFSSRISESCNSGVSSDNVGITVFDNGCSVCNAGRSSNIGGISVINPGLSVSSSGLSSTSGGPLFVSCYGPIAPSGINLNAYSDLIGDVLISGEVPFLSAVEFDGVFRSDGKASVAYGCGDGNIAIQEIIGARPGSCGYIL